MKKLSYLTFLLALCTATFFSSCENEPLTGEFFTTPDGSEEMEEGEEVSELCATNLELLPVAETAFANADETTYTETCTGYATLLDFLILECGDSDGSLQNTLNSLGDCSEINLCLQARARTRAAKVTFENADAESQSAACFAYLVALEEQIAVCGDAGGATQAIIDSLPCDNNCENATAATAQAAETFNMVDTSDEVAFVEACNAYKTALQNEINACGDTDGALLAIIQSLGECLPPEEPGQVQMTIDGEFKNFNTVNVSVSGSTLNVLATDVDVNDTFFFRVVLNQTGVNVLQDERLFVDDIEYNVVENGDNPFMDEVTENVSGILRGTFSGEMINTDGTVFVITEGIFDIMY